MVSSLFTSTSFILTESSFIIVASIAAYELIIGDFVSQKKQTAQTSAQNRGGGRGRPGYGSFQPNELQQQPAAHHGSHRERGGDAGTATRVTEEGYYASPSDRRYASPGRGSSGDATRRMFYKFILLALLSRFVLLPIETIIIDQERVSYSNIPITISSAQLQIILRISQTLPDTIFASALGLLIIFCAQIAFAALPPLSPQSGEASVQGEEDTDDAVEDGITERDGLLDEGVNKLRQGGANRLKRASRMARNICISGARLSRTILASKKTFSVFNIILSITYVLVFAAALAYPQRSASEISLWIFMITIYSFLSLSLTYVAILLGKALYPGIVRRGGVDSLALRLVGTCTLLAVMLITRLIWFSVAAHRELKNIENADSYRRSTIEYAISEPLPVLLILYMMHRKRKEVQNDVLIIHSIMNNLFGSTTQLDSTNNNMPAAQPGDGAGTGARGGGLGSRRFQTYGGQSRGDSFPPASEYKPRRNIPRAVSSSGGGRPKQQP